MRALVLSGGGSKGAYEVGVIDYLIGVQKVQYDIFAGVSVGAINAAFLAQYPKEIRVDQLESMWLGIDNSKVFRRWFPFGRLSGLWKTSIYDSTPLQKMLREKISPQAIAQSKKLLRVGAVGLDTGQYKIFDESYHDIVGAVIGSSAFPGMLTPPLLDGQLWTDGGVKSTTPLKAAIDAGADEVDVVLCSPAGDGSVQFSSRATALKIATRSLALMSDQIEEDDLQVCLAINELVQQGFANGKRYIKLRIFRPSEPLVKDPLDFSPMLIRQMIRQGGNDAIKNFTL